MKRKLLTDILPKEVHWEEDKGITGEVKGMNEFKRILRRIAAMIMALLMILTLEPDLWSIKAMAATSGTLTGLSDSKIGLRYSGNGDNAWTAEGDSIVGSVTSSTGCSNNSSTLTLTNQKTSKATLKFTYSVQTGGGSIQIDGNAVTQNGSFSKELDPNAAVSIAIQSGSTTATKISLNGVQLLIDAQVTTTFLKPENGSYTVDGTVVTADTTRTQSSLTSYQMSATPADGYQFLGWYNESNGTCLSTNAVTSLNISEDCSVSARFIPAGSAVFETGGQLYTDLNQAVQYAQNHQLAKITLKSSGSISGQYTIPSGITLLIPFDDAGTMYTTTPKVLSEGSESTDKDEYRRLTLTGGSSLTVNGAVSVGGQYRAASGSNAGRMSGAYGRIQLEDGSSMLVGNGGSLYAWGYITGSGTVNAQSGANVYEWFQIADFRGGSATMGMGNSVFPFSQYYVQNIESPLTIEKGAAELVYTGLYASRQTFGTSIHFIGDDGMFKIDSGSLTKAYDGAKDRVVYDINGTAEFNSLKLSLMRMSVDSASYVLPITSNMTIQIDQGGKLTVNQNAAVLPGVGIHIADDADLTVASGKNLYVYDQDDWGSYTCGGKFVSAVYVPGRSYNRTAADLSDAEIEVNGSLTAEGGIYTTEHGANICSSSSGVYNQSGAPGTETATHQYTQSGSSVTNHDIAISPAKLKNADGTYTETSAAKSGDSISYVNGTWGGTAAVYTVTWVNDDGTVLETDENVEAGTTPSYDGATPVKQGDAQYSYTFSGWDPEVSAVTADVTYKAVYTQTVNTYTVTWANEDGTVLAVDTVPYGQVPSYAGETPVKQGNAEHSYTFAGWKADGSEATGVKAVTGDVTYKAQFTESVNTYTVKWQNEDGTILQTDTDVPYGTIPKYKGETPAKAADAQYTYTFSGWTPAVDAITGNTTYTAAFSKTVNTYTITWKNADETVLKTETLEYGATPVYSGDTPTKQGDAQYSYTFSGWSPDIAPVTGDATYTAQFEQVVNTYTVTFKNEDGTVLAVLDKVAYGTHPTYTGATPAKADDEYYSYSFSGWDPDLTDDTAVTENVTYTAKFTKTVLHSYTVTFDANGGSGSMETMTVPCDPDTDYTLTKNAFTRENYIFTGWNTSADGTGASYADEGSVGKGVLKTDITLYAQWKLQTGWLTDDHGTTYYKDGSIAYKGQWETIDGNIYYFDESGYIVKGISGTITGQDGSTTGRFLFDAETGVFLSNQSGLYTVGADTYWTKDGMIEAYPGLVRVTKDSGEINYYYFGQDDKAVKDGTYKVEKNNGLPLPAYQYSFDADGVIVHDADTSKNGICDGDGSKYYYIDGVKVGVGLIKIDGSYYYARTSTGEIIRNRTYWVTQTNDYSIPEGEYSFDADGRMILKGFIEENGNTYYYADGSRVKGFIKIGDDYYLFNASSGMMYKNGTYWVPDNAYGIAGGMYTFGADGKLQLKNGFVQETHKDGTTYTYYYLNGNKVKGFTKIGDDYYLFNTSSGMMYKSGTYWVPDNTYGIASGMYAFDADGKLQLKNGFVQETHKDGKTYTYYYLNGDKVKGFTKIGDDYYMFNRSSGMMYTDATMWVGDNSYGIAGGMYYFGSDGKMQSGSV